MATPLVYNPKLDWVDVLDDDNVPAGARPVNASDLIKYETFMRDAKDRINEHDTTILDNKARLDALVNAAVQYATATTSAIPATATLINAALVLPFTVPPSGQVMVELSQSVKITTAGKLQWIITDSASPNAVIFTSTAATSVQDGYVTVRRLVTGLTPGASRSWHWRHQMVTGVATLQIGVETPAVMSIRAA